MKRLWVPAMFVLAAGCASAPQSPAPSTAAASMALDPVGSYVLSTNFQGQAVDGRIRIGGSPGAWSGTLYSDLTGELPLSSIRVEGQELHITADTPDGPLTAHLVFTGDTFNGDWSLGADGGALRGRREDP